MDHLTLSPYSFETVVRKTVACLRAGGVIVAPTETVYGLMTCWGNDAGRERIYRLKARDRSKLLQMLAAGADSAATGGHVSPDERLAKLVAQFCPGPLTIVANGSAGSVGLRVPDSPFILAVLKHLGGPIAATSANVSGEAPACTAAAAVENLAGTPDLIVDGGAVRLGTASTVVSLMDAEVECLREGPIALSEIQAALERQ